MPRKLCVPPLHTGSTSLPVGVVTAALGAPALVWLVARARRA